MWCCCGRKRDNSKLLDDQVKALAAKCALAANNLRCVEEENIRFRKMPLDLDDVYYELDCEVQHLSSDLQLALPQPYFCPGGHQARGR